MRTELTQIEESITITCPKCLKQTFKIIYDDNYCEMGSAIRLICENEECNGELDFKLKSEANEMQDFLERQKQLKQVKK